MGRVARERGGVLKERGPQTPGDGAGSLRRAAELADAGRPFATITVVRTEPATSARVGNRAIVLPDGTMEGWVGGGCIAQTARREGLAAIEDGRPRLVRISPDDAAAQPNVRLARMTCASEGTADLYVEPFLPRPTLLAAGDSPVVEVLAAIAPPLGFRFVKMEPGSDPEAIPYPADTWMVVASFGEFDEPAVEAGLKLGLPYVGLVASGRRAGSVLSDLRARGYGEEALTVVRSPAGLPIGASGQEEISLSVMAEIASLRAKRRPGQTAMPEVATDPVCGMAVEVATAGHTSEHGKEAYYFCCPGCKSEFDREPGKYVGRASA